MLTGKEKIVLRLLMSSFDIDYSINQIARECGLAPNGALKILKKFEKEGVLKSSKIANIKSYKINFEDEKTENILELALMSKPEKRIKYRLDDLAELKGVVKCCVLFGSYVDLKKEPHDLDVLFILDKSRYKAYKKILNSVKDMVPVKIHDVMQTEEDLKKNLKNKDKVILGVIRKGVVLWGYKILIKGIKYVYPR